MATKIYLVAFLICSVLLCGCFTRSAMMTRESFDDIQIGTSMATVKERVGKPYATHNKKDGSKEYEYVERIKIGQQLVSENHYFLIVVGDQVVGKRFSETTPSIFRSVYDDEPDFNTYSY